MTTVPVENWYIENTLDNAIISRVLAFVHTGNSYVVWHISQDGLFCVDTCQSIKDAKLRFVHFSADSQFVRTWPIV